MALTPEDVVNQKFTITKFRDGYDLDQVDDFLDTIVEEFRQHEAEKAELQAKIDELTAQLEEARANAGQAAAAPVAAAPQPVAAAPAPAATESSTSLEADAVKSSAMLQMALELHDKYVREGEETRDQLVGDAEKKSTQLVTDAERTAKKLTQDAQTKREAEMRVHTDEVKDIKGRIVDLRQFEAEYRTTLRSYIQSQLRGLDTTNEPEGIPEGVE
ncbi:DivIVA domain-containing protein [Leucobacter sp. cx-328]|uniref:DivIVA domain-containing protein n=1 Tax=unclassified Leucobacter TaxID=2621730 RepID=UPI00165D4930|nr:MULTISPECIES: DivIVA domain-containing protein [unclassified Leucobacter]MBC9944865.1 DivIVA domain-containing protein [Leucobacter sp. cx-328]